ncbi:MAG: S9 family peptidase [Phycisphaerales bacterium]|nr:S9 family peptidase [Phycisphaerales bacterium]
MIQSLLLAATAAAIALPAPPPTRIETVTDTMHGQTIADDYRWLEQLESESEAVRDWTTTQNDYTRSVLDHLPCRKALEARLEPLMTIGVVGAPRTAGTRYFYTAREGTQNQPVLYVRERFDAKPRALLDVNALSDKGLYALDWFEPSFDGQRVAFGLSYAGDEMTKLMVLDANTGAWLADEIPGKVDFAGWSPDATGFLYSRLADPADPYSRQIMSHELGRHHRQDAVLLRQEAPSRIPFASLSRDGRWIVGGIFEGWSKNELFAADANAWRRTGDFAPFDLVKGIDARFSPVGTDGDTLLVLTTWEAPNGRLLAIDLTHPERSAWREVVPEQDVAVRKEVAIARGMLVATYEKDAVTRMERFRLDGAPIGPLELPGLGDASLVANDDRTEAFVSYMSFNEPRSVYRADLATGELALWERPEVPVDPSILEVQQEWCTSKDGTRVPMFVVHRKGLSLDGNNPTLLYGYGGFNQSMTPFFSAVFFAWMEKGGVFVLANLRGGGEYGEAWHQAGMLERKQNVFDDLFAAAEHLIDRGYTSPAHLAVMGGSNGGLLTGVAATQRPDLFAAVVCQVPLLDMLRYQQFLMAKFWVPEYGSPEDPQAFEWLRAYSPYQNIQKGRKYPAILFTAGENDSRVHPLHARKMTAAMQAAAANDFDAHPILLWVDREGGHGQGKPLALRIRDVADWLSFVMWQTGLCSG